MEIDEVLSKMKSPRDIRPEIMWRQGILQIHITRACDMACTGCTQGSNLAGKPVLMTPDQFEESCESLMDCPPPHFKPYWGVVGVFGGNPTVHPDFEEICRRMQRIVPFEQRGLWSNNLRGYGKLCRETFNPEYSNLNVHMNRAAYDEIKRDWPESHPKGLQDSRHSPPWVAMQDMEDLTDDDRWNLVANCDINQLWSAIICVFRGELRAFFCEVAGAQSMLHQNEPDYPDTGLPVTPGWWNQSMKPFEAQVRKHCFACGIPLKGEGDFAVTGTTEFVSKTHEEIYKLKHKNSKNIKIVTKLSEMGRKLERATDYCENGLIDIKKLPKLVDSIKT